MEASAFEQLPAEHLRAMHAALLGQKVRCLRRAESDRGGRCMALLAPSLWLHVLV
jgi:hypothetical protein